MNRGDEEVALADDGLRCEAVTFERLLAKQELRDAVELDGGDVLSGFFLPDAGGFERWVDGERRRVRTLAVKAAPPRAVSVEALGNRASPDISALGGAPQVGVAAGRRATRQRRGPERTPAARRTDTRNGGGGLAPQVASAAS